jgi:hypothetical protein
MFRRSVLAAAPIARVLLMARFAGWRDMLHLALCLLLFGVWGAPLPQADR